MQITPLVAPAGRLKGLDLSEIVRISEAAAALKASGRDVISLGTGEPDFPTPGHVVEAAHRAALDGQTRYTPTQGTPVLRRAIAEACARDCGFRPALDEIIVSAGAKQVIHNALMATLNPGDEVVLVAPWWTSYPDMVQFAGGRVVPVLTEAANGFRPRPEDLATALGPRTRWVLLNSPGNPSGAVLSAEDMSALAEVLRAAPHVGIISDEIYQHICYVPFTSFRSVAPDLAERTLIVNGVSKSAAMTGWRLGWGIGPAALVRDMVTVQGLATSGACSVSQAAAVAALMGPQEVIAERNAAFRARRDLVVTALNATGVIRCGVPDGAFYVFADVTAAFGRRSGAGQRIDDDAAFCAALMAEEGIALVPGRAFGLPGHFRLSYAYDDVSLGRACAAIARFCAALQ